MNTRNSSLQDDQVVYEVEKSIEIILDMIGTILKKKKDKLLLIND